MSNRHDTPIQNVDTHNVTKGNIMSMDEPLMTSREVQARLKVTRQTVWRLEKQGALNPVKVGTVKRFKRSEVEGQRKIK